MQFEGPAGAPGVPSITVTLPEEQLPARERRSCRCKPGTASHFFLCAYTHVCVCVCEEAGTVPKGGHH